MGKIKLIFLLFFMYSCSNNENKLKEKFYLYENGNIKSSVNYDVKTNFKEGCEYTYYDDGKLKSIFNYKENKLHGQALIFDSLGFLLQNGTYNMGIKDGSWIYNENGDIIRAYISNNIIFGVKEYYNFNKKIEAYKLISKNENITNEIVYYEDNGQIDYSKSRFFVYQTKEKGDSLSLLLKLFCKEKFESRKISIGRYNSDYTLKDSSFYFNSNLNNDSITVNIPNDNKLNALIHLNKDTLINGEVYHYGTTIYVDLFSKNHLLNNIR